MLLAHRFHRNVHTRQADIVLGELGDGREIDLFLVSERHQGVVAVMLLQMLGIVILGEVEFLEARDDGVVDDLHDVLDLLRGLHLLDCRQIVHLGRIAHGPPVAAHHVRANKNRLRSSRDWPPRVTPLRSRISPRARWGMRTVTSDRPAIFFAHIWPRATCSHQSLATSAPSSAENEEAEKNETQFGGRTAVHINECVWRGVRAACRSPRRKREIIEREEKEGRKERGHQPRATDSPPDVLVEHKGHRVAPKGVIMEIFGEDDHGGCKRR